MPTQDLADVQDIRQYSKNIAWLLFFLLFVRLLAMYFIPLNDSTEARYGEIARIMLETGNWVTPMQEYGVPFWAKPPLSTWFSSISMYLFGVNEFAARLPSLILSCAILWMVWHIARVRAGVITALNSLLILAGSFFFYLNAGTVMTDSALLFATTLAIIAFWFAVSEMRKVWGYVFFAALGVGMLAKGPVAIVLVGMPIFFWVLLNNKWSQLWRNLPWVTGTVLGLFICLPWYLTAEKHTPGFLNYFFIGENINRFLKPGWSGDKYGFAHHVPYGYIWLYAFLGVLPWPFVLLGLCKKRWRGICGCFKVVKSVLNGADDEWLSYLFLSVISPLVFFTFARNIIYPYVFPILPFFALLMAELIQRFSVNKQASKQILVLGTCSGIIFTVVTILFVYQPNLVEKSQKRVVQMFNAQADSHLPLVYWSQKPDYSAMFYTFGSVEAISNLQELNKLLTDSPDRYLVLSSRRKADIPVTLLEKLHKVGSVNMLNNEYMLFKT